MNNTSGQTTNPHVDDVLTSIRKLVTDEEQTRRENAALSEAAHDEGDEELVLTLDMAVDEAPFSAGEQVVEDADDAPLILEDVASDPTTEHVIDDLTVDDEEFSALVREIVRDELEGTLGDKISANLRKMVRREINRALNARIAD